MLAEQGSLIMIAVSSLSTPSNGNASLIAIAGAGSELLPAALRQGLTHQQMQRVRAARPGLRVLDAGESLYFQGDDCEKVYLMLEGWAFRHQSLEDGRRQILEFALPGSAFGLPGTGTMTHSL